ncbi:MAG TPA: zincin-like metallopeptidase domain-containing protein, partial [Fimbriimonadaceae bacterium]|nr:zincin-like metallopeptidase domain-containing protein [Fimbriimonadaceae bacterium]
QQLERGVVPWRCPWRHQTGRPRNFHTGKAYQGVNVLLLGLQRFSSPFWMTFRQAQERGGSVRKGEHGSIVLKFGQFEKISRTPEGAEEKRQARFLKSYRVFNAVQIDGITFPQPEIGPQLASSQRIARAEAIAAEMPLPPKIIEGKSDRACYRGSVDTVEMPAFAVFNAPEAYYLTLFHELIHSTGHESRLARPGVTSSDGFGGKEYSREELVAEMGAAFLGVEAGIVRDEHEQSAAYLKAWLDVLRQPDHRHWIVQAANQAGRAADYILGTQYGDPAHTAEIEASKQPQPVAST